MWFRQLCHWGPLLALGIIKCITFSTLQIATTCFNPFTTVAGILSYAFFLSSVGLTLYHFFCAAIIGPGFIPLKWEPNDESNLSKLQRCVLCEGYKAPRAHHCRKCNRCVMKMDHHCPWINSCCGHRNHAHFVLFLFFAIIGSFQSTIYLGIGLYRAFNYRYYVYHMSNRNLLHFSLFHLVFTVFSLGLAIGVVLALGGLLYVQMKAILKNETNIETWIVTKARGRPRREGEPLFIYPYNLGRWRNFKYVFFPPSTTDAQSSITNGIQWPIVNSCDQYTLTIEQIKQKLMKQAISQRYTIVIDYSGSIFPISKGLRVCCSPPCSDEPRIPLSKGDSVVVTRWKRRWLYGEKSMKDKSSNPGVLDNPKGWFPRLCAAEFETPLSETEEESEEKELKKDL